MADEEENNILDCVSDNNYSTQDNLDMVSLYPQNTNDFLNHDYADLWFDRTSNLERNWYDDEDVNLVRDSLELLKNGGIENQIKIEQPNEKNDWTENEKNLLQKGIEIFGKSSSERLAQFIGTKTASEVKFYLENHLNEKQVFCEYAPINATDIEIPASIENVIGEISVEDSASEYIDEHYDVDDDEAVIDKPKRLNNKIQMTAAKGQRPKNLVKRNENSLAKSYAKFKRINKFRFKNNNNSTSRTTIEKKTRIILDANRNDYEDLNPTKHTRTRHARIEEDDDDLYIDIETLEEPNENKSLTQQEHHLSSTSHIDSDACALSSPSADETVAAKPTIDLTHFDETVAAKLTSMEIPSCEVKIDDNIITDLEKVFHEDFFKGKLTKTPERYLKIRNHIINGWKSSKPNYANKTSMRLGLKNCGDVTCISRIHYFLEQIGAINFGCAQTTYERPLLNILEQQNQSINNNNNTSANKLKPCKNILKDTQVLGSRQRIIKKRFSTENDGLGGYTLAHDEHGHIINTTIVHEEPQKNRDTIDKERFNRKLINCQTFKIEQKQSFSVQINLSALILMDFHAHTCRTEIMGMVGGLWDPINKHVMIMRYVPCKNIASSSTHCDMCPVSQIKAAEIIHSQYLQIIGWFHSHPTFAPEPSQQDLYTQNSVQQWIGYDQPCIGIILTPFNYFPNDSPSAATISSTTASPFRCMIVDKELNAEEQFIPYRLEVDVTCDNYIISDFISEMKRILFMNDVGGKTKKINFLEPYFKDHSITHLDKFILSVEAHMAKYDTLNEAKETIEAIRDFLLRERQ